MSTFKSAFGMPDSTPILQRDERGFHGLALTDVIGQPLYIRESSIILNEHGFSNLPLDPFENPGSSALWFIHTDSEEVDHRFELDRNRVDWLIDVLRHWRSTGSLKP